MTLSRWAQGAATLAIMTAGVAVAAPAAQAGPPANTTACYYQVSIASNNLSWAEYDITLPFDDAIGGVIENAKIAQTALASTACAGLESSVGADMAAAQSEIVPALRAVAEGRRTTAGEHFGNAADAAENAGYTLFFLLHPRS